jgi:hypothetical protein
MEASECAVDWTDWPMFEQSTLGEPAQEAQALEVNWAWLLDEHLKRGVVAVLADHGVPPISATAGVSAYARSVPAPCRSLHGNLNLPSQACQLRDEARPIRGPVGYLT